MWGKSGIALVAIASVCLGGNALEEWETHIDRGEAHLKYRDEPVTDEEIRRADAEFARAVKIARAANLDDETFLAFQKRVDCMHALPDWLGLLDVEYEILEFQKTLGKEGERAVALTRQDLGYLEDMLRNSATALDHLYRAEEYFVVMGDADEVAQTHIRLANIHISRSDIGLGMAFCERALARFETNGDEESQAEALMILASLYGFMGTNEQALKCLERVLALDPDGEVAPYGWYQRALGRHYARADDLDRAREHLENAIRWFREEGDVLQESRCLLSLAEVERWAGDPERARECIEQVLERKLESPVLEFVALETQARLFFETGRLDEADAAWRRSLVGSRETSDRATEIKCEVGLARIGLRTGNPKEAMNHADRALEALAEPSARQSAVTSIRGRETEASICEVALRAAFELGEPERVYAAIERTRAAVLVHGVGAGETFFDRNLPVEFKRRVERARAALAAAMLELDRVTSTRSKDRRKRSRIAREKIRTARQDLRLALEPLQRGSPVDALRKGEPLRDLAAVQRVLARDQALVLYATAAGRLRALVVTGDDAWTADLGKIGPLAAEASHLIEVMSNETDEIRTDQLRKRLIAGLSLPNDCRRLLVSPVGEIGTVPFALLTPGREVAFVPSGTSWALLAEEDVDRGRDMLAMGEPAYSSAHLRRTRSMYRTANLGSLPYSGIEVREVTGPGDVVLVGAEATEKEFRKSLARRARWRVIHFACHGLVDRRHPIWSSLALSPDEREDGYLTVLELYGMRVCADLVVLSACDSGRGEHVRGEGQLGLPAAFLYAGSRCVMASLWSVDDEVTCLFMRAFYRSWKSGTGVRATEALEHARTAVKDAGYEHPRHWAGWVLWGVPGHWHDKAEPPSAR